MSNPKPPYNIKSEQSILSHALLLLGKSLRQLYPDIPEANVGKGGLGQAVEEFHFMYKPNSNNEPDFPEAALELKCTPLKETSDGSFVSKERLVLNIINYIEEAGKSFYESSFWKKNAKLLLMFYLHEADKSRLDLIFKIIRTWQIPQDDLKIFIDDWNKIHEKIATGHAHELSEGDTFYLGACVKGAKGQQNKRKQPLTDILADQRAYSIKSSYLNTIILESASDASISSEVIISDRQKLKIRKQIYKAESIVKNIKEYKSGETFEQLIERKFKCFYGQTVNDIAKELRLNISNSAKAISYTLCRGILGVTSAKIAEFEKAGIQLKTIRLEANGNLTEAMVFSQIKWTEIAQEDEWEDSAWYKTLTQRFFFVVFRKCEDNVDKQAILVKTFFWTMPMSDLQKAKEFWLDTRDKVREGRYDAFMKASDHSICHVRPKARNSSDLMMTPQGTYEKKKGYWLNRDYILNIVRSNMNGDT